jgi:hypothetical protein
MADKTFHKVHWAKVRTFAQALGSIRTCIQRAVKPPQSPRKGHSIKIHSEYIGKLRQGVKSGAAAAAFDLTATARQAAEEAEQLMATGGIVTSVEDAADLEKVEYWQQGDANLATKENMEARKALRYHKVVLEALQIYWEAAQRSLQSGGDSSADELHQDCRNTRGRVLIRSNQTQSISCTMTDETHRGGCSTSVLIRRNQSQSVAPDEAFAASTPKLAWSEVR